MQQLRVLLTIAPFALSFWCFGCAEANPDGESSRDGSDGTVLDTNDKDATDTTDDVETTSNTDNGGPDDTDENTGSPQDTDKDSGSGDDECTPDEGVYRYCNGFTPCNCDNICAKEIIKSTSMIDYVPVGSMCLAECELNAPNSCPNEWETCGKMKESDPQAFCMPAGTVSGTWQARVFDGTFELKKNSDIPDEYLVDNDDIKVDVGWWTPAPDFTKGIVALGDPGNSGTKYYILTLMPDGKVEYGNTIDNWMFEVFISEDDWKAQTLSMKSDPAAFIVQPMLLRIIGPNVSMRTWLHGTVRTTSTFTIDNPGEICTDLDNIEGCAVASGSFKIDLFGLSGTLQES